MEVNDGRFKKGHKLGKRYEKGNVSWSSLNKGLYKNRRTSETRGSQKYKEWAQLVKERDGFKCVQCYSEKNIAAHHLKKWKEYPELRFDINNGKTLCCSCHAKEEGFQKGHISIVTQETRNKISEAHKGKKLDPEHLEKMLKGRLGKPGPNKGRKFSDEHKKKLSEAAKKRCQPPPMT